MTEMIIPEGDVVFLMFLFQDAFLYLTTYHALQCNDKIICMEAIKVQGVFTTKPA